MTFFALTKKLKWATVDVAQNGHVSTSLNWQVRLRMVGRKFCHITPCHESLAILNAPNKMCLPIKRAFNDFVALKKIKVVHSGCMLKSVMLPLASIGTWGWGWKSTKGNREKVLRHKNHLSVLFYSHVILAKPCTFPTYTVTNVI